MYIFDEVVLYGVCKSNIWLAYTTQLGRNSPHYMGTDYVESLESLRNSLAPRVKSCVVPNLNYWWGHNSTALLLTSVLS